jgi:predicted transposase YbfD/YdcC
MDGTAREFVEGLKHHFGDLKDPRIIASCDHLLLDIVAITILAVICGADDWTDLETFGRLRRDWLKTFLRLPNGIPSHDTFRRVLGLLDRRQFAACLFQWTQALHEASGGKLISIDGKTLRRSFAKRSGKAALHLVTAWSSENGLTLGQIACEDKSNEITAIPELLKLLSLRGCTVTIDAMGCQKEIAAEIRGKGGHYVLAMKGNQPGLEEDMQQLYINAIDNDFAGAKHEECETTEKAHGRTTTRNVHALEIPKDFKPCLATYDGWETPVPLRIEDRPQAGEESIFERRPRQRQPPASHRPVQPLLLALQLLSRLAGRSALSAGTSPDAYFALFLVVQLGRKKVKSVFLRGNWRRDVEIPQRQDRRFRPNSDPLVGRQTPASTAGTLWLAFFLYVYVMERPQARSPADPRDDCRTSALRRQSRGNRGSDGGASVARRSLHRRAGRGAAVALSGTARSGAQSLQGQPALDREHVWTRQDSGGRYRSGAGFPGAMDQFLSDGGGIPVG